MRNMLICSLLTASVFACGTAAAAQATRIHTKTTGASSAPTMQKIQPKMTYHDTKGHVISEAAFKKAVKSGQHFKMKLGKDMKTATLTLVPAGEAGGIEVSNGPKPKVHVGQKLPAFSLSTVAGGKATPASLHGATTLVDMFFAQCAGCIEELPALNAYAAAHPKMHFLAITFDDAKTAKTFVHKRHFQWPVAYGAGDYLHKDLGVSVFPTLFLLDSQGNLLASHIGSMPIVTVGKVASSHAKTGTTKTTIKVLTTASEAEAAQVSPADTAAQVQWLDHWVKQQATPSHRLQERARAR